jgi:hypothetical protein
VTTFVVVATANHFWLDGIVAVVLLALAEVGQSLVAGWLRRFGPEREPVATAVTPSTSYPQVAETRHSL